MKQIPSLQSRFCDRYCFYYLLSLLVTLSSGATISQYSPCLFALDSEGIPSLVAIRKGVMANDSVFLAVDPRLLSTQLVKKRDRTVRELSSGLFDSLFGKTAYAALLADARACDLPMQDAGITHGASTQQGIDLTVDLCPSKKPLDRSFFVSLIDAFAKEERPVPVSISVTGVWMKEHPGDFRWLTALADSGDLLITWINHSYSHRFDKAKPLQKNFLLEKGTNLDSEVIRVEELLVDKGELPSIFFRFPGLVSDREMYLKVVSCGLVPVGSDAWLAKNQQPNNGSIVLVHANGNEPLGLKKFFKLIKDKSATIAEKEWFLYDLRESLELEESSPLKEK